MKKMANQAKIENIAPLKPLYGLAEGASEPPPGYISDGIKELFTDIIKRDSELFREIAETSEIVSNFIEGKQLWRKNHWTDRWSVVKNNLADTSKISSINVMQFYCTSQMKMMTSSNPDLEPAEEFKRSEFKDKIKIAKAVWNKYESRFYTPWFNNQEALHAIISGTYIESVAYDNLAEGAVFFKELIEEKEIEISPGYSRCFSCGTEGSYADFTEKREIPSCPQCGGYEISPPEPPVRQMFNNIAGRVPVRTGDLRLSLIPVQAARWDVKVRAEESDWFLHRQAVSPRWLKHTFGNINLPAELATSDPGLNSLLSVQKAGNTLGGATSAGGASKTDVIIDRLSLSPSEYSHIVAGKDEETVSGRMIRKGERLADRCPDGLTILACGNGSILLGMFPGEHHSQEVTTGVYHMRYETGIGRGSEDSVEVQKRFLRLDAQNVKYLETSATPGHTFIKGAVDREHVKKIGAPNASIPINPEVVQALGSMDVIKPIAPGSMAAQFFSYTYDILNQYRQLTSHSTDFTNAFPGVDNRTATGARLAKANSDSVYSPFLQLKGEVRQKVAKKTVQLYAKHFEGVKQWMAFGETSGGQTIGGMVDGADVDTSVDFAVVRDSEQPKTVYDRQMDMANMMTLAGAAGGIQALKQTDPKLYDAMLRSFDIDIEDHTYSTVIDVCERRLEQALVLALQLEAFTMAAMEQGLPLQPPPVEAVLMSMDPAIQIEEPAHDQKMLWFMEYLDSPDGLGLGNEARAVVAMLVRTHAQMFIMQQSAIAAGFAQVNEASMGPELERQAMDKEEAKHASIADKKKASEDKANERLHRQQMQQNDQAWASQEADKQANRDAEQTMLNAGLQSFNKTK